jgi:hypothetical protein
MSKPERKNRGQFTTYPELSTSSVRISQVLAGDSQFPFSHKEQVKVTLVPNKSILIEKIEESGH